MNKQTAGSSNTTLTQDERADSQGAPPQVPSARCLANLMKHLPLIYSFYFEKRSHHAALVNPELI